MFRLPFRRVIVAGLTAFLCCLAVGCGGESGNNVSGKVTFKGQPVPAGKIYFTPDSAKGNSGPQGYAEIKDGVYDTSAAGGHEVGSGPMTVSIDGFDPSKSAKKEKGDVSGEETILMIFPTYTTTADLPDDDSTKDFDVPAEAAENVQRGEARTGEIVP